MWIKKHLPASSCKYKFQFFFPFSFAFSANIFFTVHYQICFCRPINSVTAVGSRDPLQCAIYLCETCFLVIVSNKKGFRGDHMFHKSSEAHSPTASMRRNFPSNPKCAFFTCDGRRKFIKFSIDFVFSSFSGICRCVRLLFPFDDRLHQQRNSFSSFRSSPRPALGGWSELC